MYVENQSIKKDFDPNYIDKMYFDICYESCFIVSKDLNKK